MSDYELPRYAVIGLGRFGQALARTLTAAGAEVIGIDIDAPLVEKLRDEVTLAVRLDATDEEALKAQGVHEVDVAVIGIGEAFEPAALAVATLKELGVKRIIARAENEVQARIMRRVGADEVAEPERESAQRWAHRLMLPNLTHYVELGEDHSLIYTQAPRKFHHKTLRELDLRNEFGINLIAIERRVSVKSGESEEGITRTVFEIPKADTTILPTDTLVLVGSNEALEELPKD